MLINDFTLQAESETTMKLLTKAAYGTEIDDCVMNNVEHILK